MIKNIQEKLEKIVQKHLQPGRELGYAASVELDGKSLLKHYSGNVELDGVYHPVNENTPFDVASIAKQFVACCIAMLACEKRLNLDDSVRVYLPEMKEYAEKITIRHCISMTSGVRNVYLMKYLMGDSPLDEMEMFFRQEQSANEAGNFNSYSEACYILLGHIVERLTGGNADFAKQRIFEPLGMANTQGHSVMGGGGLTSTAEDLVKWHNCLTNRNLPDAPEGLFDVIFSRFKLNGGGLCPYGFGFFYDEQNYRDIIWQYGDNTGWQSVIRADLQKKLSVIVLTHSDCEPVDVALELENAVIGEVFNSPGQNNYKSAYYSRPQNIANIKNVKHHDFPDAQKQNPITDRNRGKYIGRYYGYEIDTYFDIVPDGNCFQMQYAYKNGGGYMNLLDFSDENKIMARTCGDWGGCWFPMEFYGDENKIDFFTLREGIGHFYFVKCMAQNPKLIIVAGMSGTGKSTTAQNISYQYKMNGIDHEWYHEEMEEHPIRWANGGEFTVGDLNTEDGMKLNIADIYARWKTLTEYIKSKNKILVMDGCFDQNIIRYFYPGNYPNEKIVRFYDGLLELLQSANLHLIHLYSPDVAANYKKAFKVRGKKWEHIITDGNKDYDFADMTKYQELALKITGRYSGNKLCIDTSGDDWENYMKKICRFLDLQYYDRQYLFVADPGKYIGYFEYKDDKSTESVDIIYESGELFCSPDWFTHIKMNAISENKFELSAFPMILEYQFVDNDVYITVGGNYDWGIVGKKLKRIK